MDKQSANTPPAASSYRSLLFQPQIAQAQVVQGQQQPAQPMLQHQHLQHQPQHHDVNYSATKPECTTAEEGAGPLYILGAGLILMIIGTSLMATGAVYPLCITGGSIILFALGWH
eukprot:COSAG01_NODE_34809_length_541_cov_5.185520_1_plen_114_part_10